MMEDCSEDDGEYGNLNRQDGQPLVAEHDMDGIECFQQEQSREALAEITSRFNS